MRSFNSFNRLAIWWKRLAQSLELTSKLASEHNFKEFYFPTKNKNETILACAQYQCLLHSFFSIVSPSALDELSSLGLHSCIVYRLGVCTACDVCSMRTKLNIQLTAIAKWLWSALTLRWRRCAVRSPDQMDVDKWFDPIHGRDAENGPIALRGCVIQHLQYPDRGRQRPQVT